MAKLVTVGRADDWRHNGEIDELLLRIKGLVFARAILEERGVGAAALEEHGREIDRLRERLAQVVQRDGFDAAA